jgi:hypothetical protein
MVLHYQKGHIDIRDVVEEVALLVYSYPMKKYGWQHDLCSEFFCYFYNRMFALINKFEFQGKPFEVYLFITLRYQTRSYIKRKKKELLYRRIFTHDTFWMVREHEPYYRSDTIAEERPAPLQMMPEVYQPLRATSGGTIEDVTAKRRLLFLTLAGSFHITISLISVIASIIGYEREWLFACIVELRDRIDLRRHRIEELEAKRNRAFLQIYRLHEQLRDAVTSKEREALHAALSIEKQRMYNAIEELSHVHLAPTHKDLAEVLGIPKGSIDSGLYYIKHALGDLLE